MKVKWPPGVITQESVSWFRRYYDGRITYMCLISRTISACRRKKYNQILRDTMKRLSSFWATARREKCNQILRNTMKLISNFWATARKKKYNQILRDIVKLVSSFWATARKKF